MVSAMSLGCPGRSSAFTIGFMAFSKASIASGDRMSVVVIPGETVFTVIFFPFFPSCISTSAGAHPQLHRGKETTQCRTCRTYLSCHAESDLVHGCLATTVEGHAFESDWFGCYRRYVDDATKSGHVWHRSLHQKNRPADGRREGGIDVLGGDLHQLGPAVDRAGVVDFRRRTSQSLLHIVGNPLQADSLTTVTRICMHSLKMSI